jgi:hypothetical protein
MTSSDYYQRNREKCCARAREYYRKNQDHIRAWNKLNYWESRDAILAKKKLWRMANPEKEAARQRRRCSSPKRVEYQRNYRMLKADEIRDSAKRWRRHNKRAIALSRKLGITIPEARRMLNLNRTRALFPTNGELHREA